MKGVTGGSIYNCDFRWISGNGIVIYDDGGKNPTSGDACQDIRIVNNVNCTKATYEQTGIGARNNRWISNVTTVDPAITGYAGRKTNYIWPVKHEAESMTSKSMADKSQHPSHPAT